MKVSENDLREAVKYYFDAYDKYYKGDGKEEDMLKMIGAGRVLTLIGIDIEGLRKRNHCPVCGWHFGRRDPDDCCDPECPRCYWMGKI